MKVQLIGSDKVGKKLFKDSLDLSKGWKKIINMEISNKLKAHDFYLLMFDLSNEESYIFIKNYLNLLDSDKYIIIGNKSDIESDLFTPIFSGEQKYIKISAKYQQHITEPINEMFKMLT